MGSATSTHEPLDHKNAPSNFKRHASCRGTKIEFVALRWAMQCQRGHDKCRKTPEFEHVEQNYRISHNTTQFSSSNKSFTGWIRRLGMIDHPDSMVHSFVGGPWSPSTLLIWAETYRLGCGQISYLAGGKLNKSVVVCNYGPGGNVQNKTVYEVGEPASKCPVGTSRSQKYSNLCVSPDDLAHTMECSSAVLIKLELFVLVTTLLRILRQVKLK